MTNEEGHDSLKYRCAVWAALGLALGAAACGSDHGGLASNATTGDVGMGAGGTQGTAGTSSAGNAGPAPSITVLVSPFLGPYLADSGGRTLFTYGADLAGDCNYLPISGCDKDCLIAWPVFYAGARTLAPGLDDGAFGTIQRPDFT